jgi:hypothetical protein
VFAGRDKDETNGKMAGSCGTATTTTGIFAARVGCIVRSSDRIGCGIGVVSGPSNLMIAMR